MTKVSLLAIYLVTIYFSVVQCQYFSSDMTDQLYLDITHDKVKKEVVESRALLEEQAEVVQQATRAYIGAKIKENLFKALRILAEKELETLSMQHRPRQPRQDEDDDEETTTERGLIPQLANIVKVIFGSNVNVTKYVESASKFLPRPIGSQLVGVVSLLDPSQFTTTTAPRLVLQSTPGPVNVTVVVPQYVPANGVPQYIQGSQSQTVRPVTTSETRTQPSTASQTTSGQIVGGDGDDDDEGIRSQGPRRTAKQMKGLDPMLLLNSMEALWKNFGVNENTTQVAHVKVGVTTESDAGFDDEFTTKASRTKVVIKGAMTQAQNLRKGVPDLFQGAREAYKFLETINGFLDKWSARLAAGSAEDDE